MEGEADVISATGFGRFKPLSLMSAFPLKADIRSHLNERFRAFLFPICRHINYENNQLSANPNFKNQFKNPLPKESFSILKIKAQFFLNSHSIVIITSNTTS